MQDEQKKRQQTGHAPASPISEHVLQEHVNKKNCMAAVLPNSIHLSLGLRAGAFYIGTAGMPQACISNTHTHVFNAWHSFGIFLCGSLDA
jgi:hypothetical protein